MTMTPRLRPQQWRDKSIEILKAAEWDGDLPVILGMRGYFMASMGDPERNDRGSYDDAIFVISKSEHKSFWANTDPSRYRKGYGYTESKKGMAELTPGIWQYRRGLHKRDYEALVQAAAVTVKRDGSPDYLDTGWFGINIHKGGFGTTSSLGCQTIHPDQWSEFMRMVNRVMDEADVKTIPYVLVEQQG